MGGRFGHRADHNTHAATGVKILFAFSELRCCIATPLVLMCARVAGCGAACDAQKWLSGPFGGVTTLMKTTKSSANSEPEPRLLSVTQYLEKNFPDFFAEARFQVGDDDYFLYSRFGQYLARSIEHNRTPRQKINRGFTVLNKIARLTTKDPALRGMMVSGPLEHFMDAPKARALARKRLSPVAQGMLESLCE